MAASSPLAVKERSSQSVSGVQLTEEEISKYASDGYVVPKFKLSADETARLRGLLYRLFEENPKWASHTNSPHIPGSGTMGVKSFPGWMEFCEHPAILDMVEQLMGPDIILYGTSTFYKKAAKGWGTPWHRDGVNVPIRPMSSVLVWIAATDCGPDNGCLRVVPGSHLTESLGKHSEWKIDGPDGTETGTMIDPSEIDESKALDMVMEAGQMLIFDAHTLHGANPNEGTRDRASFTLRYMSARSRYEHDSAPEKVRGLHGFHTRPLILVRGVDHAGNDFERGHPGIDPNVPTQK